MRTLLNTVTDEHGNQYRLYFKQTQCMSPDNYVEIAFESEYDGAKSKQPQTKWKTTLPVECLNNLKEALSKNG